MLNGRRRLRDLPDLDRLGVEELAELGLDLSQPVPLEFVLLLPSHDAAERLRRTLESRGYATTVTPDGAANRWECQATTCLVPDPKGLGMLRAEFTALAAAERGLYAGWRPLPPEEETPPASPTD